ncbi:MAG: NUDIX hydrolase [Betaproteobacteria bacterium]|nr:NUDIX hydrolase [Betaproteobacteria bacterium]
MIWKPNVTVAAVIEREGRFLLVEEETEEGIRYNQPAGHLEPGESLIDAVVRETLEESAWRFIPEYLVGIYHWRDAPQEITWLRFAFGGRLDGHEAGRALDAGIIAAHWLDPKEIAALAPRHRSPMVPRVISDWQAGRRYPLDLLNYHAPERYCSAP